MLSRSRCANDAGLWCERTADATIFQLVGFAEALDFFAEEEVVGFAEDLRNAVGEG